MGLATFQIISVDRKGKYQTIHLNRAWYLSQVLWGDSYLFERSMAFWTHAYKILRILCQITSCTWVFFSANIIIFNNRTIANHTTTPDFSPHQMWVEEMTDGEIIQVHLWSSLLNARTFYLPINGLTVSLMFLSLSTEQTSCKYAGVHCPISCPTTVHGFKAFLSVSTSGWLHVSSIASLGSWFGLWPNPKKSVGGIKPCQVNDPICSKKPEALTSRCPWCSRHSFIGSRLLVSHCPLDWLSMLIMEAGSS